jgi:hypothetical protein
MSKSGFKKGRLGIGTDNPRYPLDVVGDIRLTGGFRDASGNDFNFLAINNQDILKTPDIAGITCVNSKVGIFNVNPIEQLDVSGNINFTGILKQDGVEFGGGVFNGVQYISGSNVSIYISGDDTTHANATGQGNVSLGTGCLTSIALGQENIAIGKDSLNSVTNTSNNIAIGSESLESCISNYNIGIGYLSGRYITSGSNNIAIGFSSMDRQDVGDSNVAIGEESLYYFNNGSGNVALGKKALYGNMSNSGGNHNIGIGSLAGLGVKNGNKNICIGYFAGPTDAMKDYHERLYIDKGRNGTDSFIYGHMDSTNPILAFNAKVGIGKDSPGEHLDVSGNINFTGTLKQDGVEFGGGKFEDGTTSGQIYYNGGNVGIGTTSPNYKLEVEMSGGNGGLRVKNTTNSAEAVIWTEPDYASYLYFGANNANKWSISSRASGEGYDLKFYRFNPGALEVMTMDYATGNVGIGTTGPSHKLHISGGGLLVDGNNSTITQQGTHIQWNRSGGYGETWIINNKGSATVDANVGIKFGMTDSSGTVSEKMFINYAGNVGIGTTSPDTLLHIQKSDTGYTHNTDALIVLERNDSNNNWINFVTKDGEEAGLLFASSTANAHGGVTYRNTDGMTFRTGGNNVRMAIDETGNVGIGTTDPGNFKLKIYNSTGTNTTGSNSWHNHFCVEEQTTAGAGITFKAGTNTGYIYYGSSNGSPWVGSGSFGFATTATGAQSDIKMVIRNDGNVGIGTTGPNQKLNVNDSSSSATGIIYPLKINNQAMHTSANQGGGVGIRFGLYDNAVTDHRYSQIAGISEDVFSGGTAIAFYTNSSVSTPPPEVMRINASGNVGIGTTTPARPFQINTDEQASIQLERKTGSGYARIGINTEFSIGEMNGGDIPWATDRSQMNAFFIEYSGGESAWNNEGAYFWMNGDYTGFANTGDANANGGVLHYYDSDLAPTGQGNGTWYINYDGSITNNSDIRLKENIRYFDDEYNISNIKEKYSQIKFCKYNYKKPLKDPSGVKRDYYGIIAQELELLFPETICQDNKGIRSFKNNVLQCITSHITANLIKENQELKTEVTTLKTELAAIKHHLGLA